MGTGTPSSVRLSDSTSTRSPSTATRALRRTRPSAMAASAERRDMSPALAMAF